MNRPLRLAILAILLAFESAGAQTRAGAPDDASGRRRFALAVGIDPFSRMGRGTAYAASAAAMWTLEGYDNLRAELGVTSWWIGSSISDYYAPTDSGWVVKDVTTDVFAVGPTADVNARLLDAVWASISLGFGVVPYAAAGDEHSAGTIVWLGVKLRVQERLSIGITATSLNKALNGEQYFPVMLGWTFR